MSTRLTESTLQLYQHEYFNFLNRIGEQLPVGYRVRPQSAHNHRLGLNSQGGDSAMTAIRQSYEPFA